MTEYSGPPETPQRGSTTQVLYMHGWTDRVIGRHRSLFRRQLQELRDVNKPPPDSEYPELVLVWTSSSHLLNIDQPTRQLRSCYVRSFIELRITFKVVTRRQSYPLTPWLIYTSHAKRYIFTNPTFIKRFNYLSLCYSKI